MNGRGKLYFKYGTMGSAKTALLLTQAYNFEERGLKYLCMKPIIEKLDNSKEFKDLHPENIYPIVVTLDASKLDIFK